MSESIEWRDAKYKEVFDGELLGLERRKNFDSSCTIKDIEGILQHLYIKDGANIDGRGGLQDIIIAATIAAYECFIAQWKTAENAEEITDKERRA